MWLDIAFSCGHMSSYLTLGLFDHQFMMIVFPLHFLPVTSYDEYSSISRSKPLFVNLTSISMNEVKEGKIKISRRPFHCLGQRRWVIQGSVIFLLLHLLPLLPSLFRPSTFSPLSHNYQSFPATCSYILPHLSIFPLFLLGKHPPISLKPSNIHGVLDCIWSQQGSAIRAIQLKQSAAAGKTDLCIVSLDGSLRQFPQTQYLAGLKELILE